jgi:hypothetical protein
MTDDQALEAAVRDLADTLEELRAEFRDPPRGPLGLPRPPSPRQVLRLTEQHTIPAIVAVLETNIRLLELLAAAIRVADGRPLDAVDGDEGLLTAGSRTLEAAGRKGGDGLAAASRATLERLDDALAELQDAADGGEADDPEVQRLLSEARRLRATVDERLAEATRARESGADDSPDSTTADTTGAAEQPGGGPVEVDVEEELNTLRRQADRPDDDAADGDDGDGSGDGSGEDSSGD